MRVTFEKDYETGIALLPTIVILWEYKEIAIGWLFWGLLIKF